jgi:hypothetical protein
MHTGYRARIVAHSKSPDNTEIVTMEATYPRFIHAEIMTHRASARNAQSSRATPTRKVLEAVLKHPAGFVHWGQNQGGMQARNEVHPILRWLFAQLWYGARFPALLVAFILWKLGAHKQVVNRILEPWSWITVVLTMTGDALPNFFGLRAHPDAQPEFQKIAWMLYLAYVESRPKRLKYHEWHLPYVVEQDYYEASERFAQGSPQWWELLKKCSTARCCRVSTLNHDGLRIQAKDLDTYAKLLYPPYGKSETWTPNDPRHTSPFEHVAKPSYDQRVRSGPFLGWIQHRKEITGETITKMPERLTQGRIEMPTFV